MTAQTAPSIRFRDGTRRVQRARGETLLIATDRERPIRVSQIANELMPLLARGTTFDELATHLRQRHPRARDVAATLTAFLSQLEAAQLVETGATPAAPVPRARIKRFHLGNPDRFAAAVARVITWGPVWLRRGVLAALGIAAVAGIVLVGLGALRPQPSAIVRWFDPLGFAAFVLGVAPLHELAHAIACRAVGAPVSGAGILMHGGVVPGPYVDTTQAYLISDRWRRFWIPAAGPLIDLLGAGAAAWGVVLADHAGYDSPFARYLMVLCLFFFYFDTNPLLTSDGSRMLEAAFDDELARRAALGRRRVTQLVPAQIVRRYRLLCLLHLLLAVGILRWFAR
jgi:putative peptide zinc metalloprotease protein